MTAVGAAIAARRRVSVWTSVTGSEVNWRTLFLLWMFSRTASALLPELQHELMAINVNAAKEISLIKFFMLVSVKRHSVGLHAYLLPYGCKYLLVSLASFLCLACDEVKVGCSICKHLIDEVYDEFHILLYEAS